MAALRAAVVGAGYLGTYHAEKYAALPGVELVAVVDTDLERAAALAQRLHSRAEADFHALLREVDCVTIATPTVCHFEMARAFLERRVDVLVEKPLAATVAEARALVELAGRNGCILQVGHVERFNPAVRAMLELIDAPRFIECTRLAPFGNRGTDVDVVRDLMIHDLDVILRCVRAPLERLEAVGVPVLSPHVDIASVRLRFADRCIANLTASRVALKRERKIRLFQADTYLSVDYGEHRVRVCRKQVENGQPTLVVEERSFGVADSLREEVESFVLSVRTRRPPAVDGSAGLQALELAERINACMETE